MTALLCSLVNWDRLSYTFGNDYILEINFTLKVDQSRARSSLCYVKTNIETKGAVQSAQTRSQAETEKSQAATKRDILV